MSHTPEKPKQALFPMSVCMSVGNPCIRVFVTFSQENGSTEFDETQIWLVYILGIT